VSQQATEVEEVKEEEEAHELLTRRKEWGERRQGDKGQEDVVVKA
jgi:hypothetical protein